MARALVVQHVEVDAPALAQAFVREWPDEARHLPGGPAAILAGADVRPAALAAAVATILGRFAATARCARSR